MNKTESLKRLAEKIEKEKLNSILNKCKASVEQRLKQGSNRCLITFRDQDELSLIYKKQGAIIGLYDDCKITFIKRWCRDGEYLILEFDWSEHKKELAFESLVKQDKRSNNIKNIFKPSLVIFLLLAGTYILWNIFKGDFQ